MLRALLIAVLSIKLIAASTNSTSSGGDSIEAAFKPILDSLFAQVDKDGDGKLSSAEGQGMIDDLGLKLSTIADFNAMDESKDGFVTKTEIRNYVTSKLSSPTYEDQEKAKELQAAIVGSPQLPNMGTILTNSPSEVRNSKFEVKGNMVSSAYPIFAGTRDKIRSKLAVKAGVSTTAVYTLFKGKKASSSRRRLAAGDSTEISFSIFVADSAAAANVESALAPLADATAASTEFGITITSSTMTPAEAAPGSVSPGLTGAIIGIVLLILLAILSCVFAGMAAKRKRTGAPEGCCQNGCCGAPEGLNGWMIGVFLTMVFLLVGTFILYTNMGKVTTAIMCILTKLLELATLSLIKDMTSSLDSVLGLVRTLQPYLNLLPIAVLLPGLLAAISMVLMLIFAFKPCCKNYCCAKTWFVFDVIFLLLGLILYIIFAALGYAVSLPLVQDQLSRITSVCYTLPIQLNQALADGQSALDLAVSGGVAASQLSQQQTQVADAQAAVTTFDATCTCVFDLLNNLNALFTPGALCTCAILLAWITTHGMCCTMGCCKNPFDKIAPA